MIPGDRVRSGKVALGAGNGSSLKAVIKIVVGS